MTDHIAEQARVAAETVLKTLEEKAGKYGNSHEKASQMLRCIYPFGIEPSQYERALKVFRICEKLARGKFTDPDIAAYALMLMDVRKDVETSDSDRKEEPKRPECTGYIGDGGPCARRVTPHSDFYYGCPDCEYGGLWQKEQPAKEEPGKPSCYQGDGNSQCHIWVTEEHALAWGCKSCPWGGAWKEGKEGEK